MGDHRKPGLRENGWSPYLLIGAAVVAGLIGCGIFFWVTVVLPVWAGITGSPH